MAGGGETELKHFLSDFKVIFGALVLGAMLLGAIFVPMLTNVDPNSFDPMQISEPQPPSFAHPFGTDDLGRDVFVRSIFGARISLAVGFIAVGVSILIGIFVGVISGYISGLTDEVIMRFVDLFMSIPTIFLILIIQAMLKKPNIYTVMLVIGLTSWMGVARLVRAEVMSVRERLFITAVRARAVGHIRIIFKHILPHTLGPIIVAAMLGIGSAILTESVLSFLGLGVQPPHASWGNMLENSLAFMFDYPWLAIIPGLLIMLTVLSLNFLGDGLRKVFSPQERY